jgi:DNA-binding NarL/FixJ family response regulator
MMTTDSGIALMTTIVLADDHHLVRQALRRLLETTITCTVVGEASDGQQAIELVTRLQPDLLILDMAMPTVSGLEVLQAIRSAGLPTRVVVVSVYSQERYIQTAYRAGAAAYVSKEALADELINVVCRIAGIPAVSGPQRTTHDRLQYGMIAIDLARRVIEHPNMSFRLTPIEVRLLHELIHAIGQMVSYKHLLEHAWGRLYGVESSYLLHEHIRNIRRKLGEPPRRPVLLRNIVRHGYVLAVPDPPVQTEVVPIASPSHGLTSRECEIVVLVARGLSNRAVADALGVRASTVDTHLRHVYPKLGITSRVELTLWAVRNGMA